MLLLSLNRRVLRGPLIAGRSSRRQGTRTTWRCHRARYPTSCPTNRAGRPLPGPAGTVRWMSLEVPARISNRRQFSTWPPEELENDVSRSSAAPQHWHQLATLQSSRQRTTAHRRRWVAHPGTPDLPQIPRGRWAVSVAARRSDQVPLPVRARLGSPAMSFHDDVLVTRSRGRRQRDHLAVS